MNKIIVPILLALPALGPVAVRYKTRDGTAKAGEHYYLSKGEVIFSKGETRRQVVIETIGADATGEFYLDLFDPVNGDLVKPDATITLTASQSDSDLTTTVTGMLSGVWGYIQRATGSTIAEDGMPELITADGLVRNNQFVGGALGGYTPDGTASSEGIALLMRGVVRAYAATKDPAQAQYAQFLFDASCKYFFRDHRPTNDPAVPWWHSWIVNAGDPFNVRGPIPESGDLALAGYIGGRDSESNITFTGGVGYLTPPPDVLYQVVTADAEFVWDNVFSDLLAGSQVEVDYYINAKGNRVHGTQKGGSFGQPIDEVSGETPGKVVLRSPLSGAHMANFCVTVPDVEIPYGTLYEAWPMWRELYANEISTAADALHWYYDTFALAADVNPEYPAWALARDRMLDAWRTCCTQESNTTTIFQEGASGVYNNFPLSYSFAYGRTNVDNPATQWSASPPTTHYTAERTPDGYVSFGMPAENAAPGSGGAVRYGVEFENEPLYLNYTPESKVSIDTMSTQAMSTTATIEDAAGKTFAAGVLVPTEKSVVQIGIRAFLQFQSEPGDATGDKTGDWSDDGEYVPPVYSAVTFPGPKLAIIGDSISYQNTSYSPPKANLRFAYYSFGVCGYWTFAAALSNHRLLLEPGLQPNVNGFHSGYNFGVAGSKVENWWLEEDDTLGDGVLNMGPMWAANTTYNNWHCAVVLGGTNDAAANTPAARILLNIKKACYDIASKGKWVFVQTIPPRTTDLLTGYSSAQQMAIRLRIKDVNQGLRDWIATDAPPNMWLVDTYDLLVGPNGLDPAGSVSSLTDPNAPSTPGNFRTDAPGAVFMADGLHPSPSGAYVIGKKLAEVLIAAGVPNRQDGYLGTTGLGLNRLPNTAMVTTTTRQLKKSNVMGRALGLGTSLTDRTHAAEPGDPYQGLGLGYQHGKVPDYWFFYRASNADGESFSNFGEYSWQDLVGAYPQVQPYQANSTWSDGAAQTEIVTIDGKKGYKVTFAVPRTGNKNEAFVVRTYLPRGQHGKWDDYSYGLPTTNPQYGERYRPNTEYSAGQAIAAEAEVRFSNIKNVGTFRMSLNFLCINNTAVGEGDSQTSGAVISGLAMGQNFWPPSVIDNVRMHPEPANLVLRTPFCFAPVPAVNEPQQYVQLNWEFSVDASQEDASLTVIILDPRLNIFNGVL